MRDLVRAELSVCPQIKGVLLLIPDVGSHGKSKSVDTAGILLLHGYPIAASKGAFNASWLSRSPCQNAASRASDLDWLLQQDAAV